MKATGRRRTYDDGKAEPTLPAMLSDGEAVVMIWLEDELPEYRMDHAVIESVFAVDAAGRRVSKRW